MFEPHDELQLGDYDLPRAVLTEPGVPLTELVGEQGAASVQPMVGPVPESGWRVIRGPFPPGAGESCVLAAPWQASPSAPGASSGWMQVSFTRFDGRWSAIVKVDWRPVRPARSRRRLGLELRLPSPRISAPAGSTPPLRLVLANSATEPWRSDGMDSDLAFVRVVEKDGEPFEGPRADLFGIGFPVQPLTDLDVGATRHLSPVWATDIQSLPAGEYRIEAELHDLQLRSPWVTLSLT